MILDNDDGGGRRGGEGEESKVNDDEEWQGIEKKERICRKRLLLTF